MVNREACSCEQVWKEISNYLEGEVDAGLRAAMDDHFRTCPRCRSVLDGMRNVIHLYGDERMIEVPSGFGRRLERRLARSARTHDIRWSSWSAWLVPAAALLLIVGGVRISSSRTVPHPMLSEHAQPGHNIPPEMLVVVSEGAKDFHVPSCGVIHNKDKARTLTAKQAIEQGYVPCVRCMRKYLETADLRPASLESVAFAYLDAEEDAEHHGR
jgi:hypothetical protein